MFTKYSLLSITWKNIEEIRRNLEGNGFSVSFVGSFVSNEILRICLLVGVDHENIRALCKTLDGVKRNFGLFMNWRHLEFGSFRIMIFKQTRFPNQHFGAENLSFCIVVSVNKCITI